MTERMGSTLLEQLAPTDSPWLDACDCHIHIYDPQYAYCEEADLRPPPATVSDYRQLQTRWGTSRVVVIQPSSYGTNNACTLNAVAAFGAQARAVVVIDSNTSAEELVAMHAQGARGVRFNLLRPSQVASDEIQTLAEKMAPLGWHLQLHASAAQIASLGDTLKKLPIPLVFDHLARLPVDGQHPAQALVEELLQQGRAWLKLSGLELYQANANAALTQDTGLTVLTAITALTRHFIRIAPDRMLWGTNWPHPANSKPGAPAAPDTSDLLRWFIAAGDETTLLRQILVANPAQLYGFDA